VKVLRRSLLLLVLATVVAAAGCGARASDEAEPAAVDETNRWALVEPADERMDAGELDEVDRHVERDLTNVLSLLVARNGRLVLERYYRGHERGDTFPVYSVTKSFLSALVGIALRDGQLKSLDQRVVTFFPGLPANPAVREVTLRDLLTMRAGFDVDEEEDSLRAPDPVRHVLGRPLAAPPGTTFAYDGRASHVLSSILTEVTGMSAAELASRELFPRLGIEPFPVWPSDPQRRSYGAGGLELTTRDIAKLGQLYLQDGRWNGHQIIPAAYVGDSTKPHVDTGYGGGYGYQWWIVDDGDLEGFAAIGYGGQHVVVIPALELVVAMTADPAGVELDAVSLVRDIAAAATDRGD
jgi:CubicO group peptidase (beta-lactamase class C family)